MSLLNKIQLPIILTINIERMKSLFDAAELFCMSYKFSNDVSAPWVKNIIKLNCCCWQIIPLRLFISFFFFHEYKVEPFNTVKKIKIYSEHKVFVLNCIQFRKSFSVKNSFEKVSWQTEGAKKKKKVQAYRNDKSI